MSTPSRMGIATEVSPLTVLVRGVLEWACPASFFETLFDRVCRPTQWTRKHEVVGTIPHCPGRPRVASRPRLHSNRGHPRGNESLTPGLHPDSDSTTVVKRRLPAQAGRWQPWSPPRCEAF